MSDNEDALTPEERLLRIMRMAGAEACREAYRKAFGAAGDEGSRKCGEPK